VGIPSDEGAVMRGRIAVGVIVVLFGLTAETGHTQETHALVVAGLGGTEEYRQEFTSWTTAIHEALTARFGLADDRVHVLGERPELAADVIQDRSTRDNVVAALGQIASGIGPSDQVLVMLRNPGYFAPFEIFSRLLPLPKYSSYDPTPLIGIFFPVLFGMILGDIGYGAILLLVSIFLAWRYSVGRLAGDIGKVLGVASLYTIAFGFLYGELFGDLGEHWLGLQPVWFDRAKTVLPMADLKMKYPNAALTGDIGTMGTAIGPLNG